MSGRPPTVSPRVRCAAPSNTSARTAAAALLIALTLAVGRSAGAEDVDVAAVATRHGFAPDVPGVVLFDAGTGEILAQHGADRPFIPASTTKVTTALAALEILGPEHRFATTLLATGEIANGTLHGDLYLRGGGDPTLSSDGLRDLVAGLRRAGIQRVDGAFFFDESLYPRAAEIDPLQPESAPYNPAVSALSVNYNRLELRWQRDAAGKPAARLLSPADGGALPVHGIATGALDDDLDPRIELVFASDPSPRWLVSPRLAATGSVFVPVRGDPGPVAAELLTTLAARDGITLPPARRGTAPDGAREVARHESPPLAEVVTGLLRYSNNLTAELTGLAASHRLAGGTALALEPSARRLAAWWQDRLPETSFAGFVAANHSGLSSVTRHTPRQMAAVLRYGAAGAAAGVRLQDVLPTREVGENGRPATDGAPGTTVRAKSGTLLYADGLVGFLTTRRGRELGFVILLTDADARARLDAGRDVRIAATPPEANDWTGRAKALERDLVARWSAD
ncbi:D-alanyl-D-alanine carboxypeptidase/D-alanyl-D-alanine-endopeptidase [Candidatus Binatia bacterium]|jgi:D-alanyl-D-alanine carboxypeptidase/D-alanyl-D-alanine-endopeptidase (penicillin-binding protein 4)|nr:D-alanyl-D-alanine carboxypeptidase/D-alanyl-D-alanine-endopeptidase [Candidatus Binatia bacterium]